MADNLGIQRYSLNARRGMLLSTLRLCYTINLHLFILQTSKKGRVCCRYYYINITFWVYDLRFIRG